MMSSSDDESINNKHKKDDDKKECAINERKRIAKKLKSQHQKTLFGLGDKFPVEQKKMKRVARNQYKEVDAFVCVDSKKISNSAGLYPYICVCCIS